MFRLASRMNFEFRARNTRSMIYMLAKFVSFRFNFNLESLSIIFQLGPPTSPMSMNFEFRA